MKKLTLITLFSSLILLLCSSVEASVEFDGVDDVIRCGSDASLDDITNLTVSAWIYVVDGWKSRIVHKRNSNTGAGWHFCFDNKWSKTIEFEASSNNNGADAPYRIASDNSISLNTWHHVLVTWTRSINASDIKLFVDGIETGYKATADGVGFIDTDAYESLLIGNSAYNGRPWNGKLTEIAIWNVILTPNEISQLATSGIKGTPLQVRPSNLKAYWPLNDYPDGTSGDGKVFNDLGGNRNNGTGNNGSNDTGLICKAEEIFSNPNQPPVASASANPTSGNVPLLVQFTGSGNDPDGYITSYHWDFGDGYTSSEQNPLYTYQNIGTYIATLTVTDDFGDTGSDRVTIAVGQETFSVQVPKKMRFQGKLKDDAGLDVEGTLQLTFKIYDVPTGGTPLWTEILTGVVVEEGRIDVILGKINELNLPFDKEYYLGVEVEQDGEMIPRFELTSVPYALRSEN